MKADYAEPQLRNDLSPGGTAGVYDGLDRFGHIKDYLWRDYNRAIDAVRIDHGYDYAGNRVYREDTVSKGQGTPVYLDEFYTYDGLNELTSLNRGQLNVGKTAITGTAAKEEDWTLDALGNWTGYVQKTAGSTDLNQARTFNAANETTQIDSSTTHVAHDAAGNMTKLPKPSSWSAHYDLTFDAWNRLVEVDDASSVVAKYQYDARNFRVVKKTYSGGSLSETRHFYYDGSWQVVEERLESGGVVSSNANRQYVWGLRYTDDLVLRDRDTTGNGTLDERLYALQDPNWNVAAIANTSGVIQERYTYAAYGKPSFLDATFTVRSPNATSYVWDSLYTGRQFDPETGFYYYRNRFYSAELGRFASRDPIGYAAGTDLYCYGDSHPLDVTDPRGEDADWSESDCPTTCKAFYGPGLNQDVLDRLAKKLKSGGGNVGMVYFSADCGGTEFSLTCSAQYRKENNS